MPLFTSADAVVQAAKELVDALKGKVSPPLVQPSSKQLKALSNIFTPAVDAAKEQQQFDEGKEILLGSNKHPNPKDKMKQELELYPFVKINQRKTLIEPIIEKRLAEKLEQERLKKED